MLRCDLCGERFSQLDGAWSARFVQEREPERRPSCICPTCAVVHYWAPTPPESLSEKIQKNA